jgi:hypothetical protein
VDVSLDIFGAVELNNPINLREVNTSGGDISGEQNSVLFLHKLKENSCSFVLVLLTMELK